MRYKLTVYGYDSGLNELLNAQTKIYDKRTRKYKVFNPEKTKNDRLCVKAIKESYSLKKVHINNPVFIRYRFFVPNKKRDRSNFSAGFVKSFEDALQHCKIISNDTYDLVLTPEYFFEVDRENPRVEVEIVEVEK